MTLLQEEQEKPQSKAGPTRHAKIMRGIVTPIFGLLAIACIVLGVLNATIWKPSAQVTASASVTGSQYVVTDPKGTILNEVGSLLDRKGYRIKSLNLINFKKSMKYNPLAYARHEVA